MKPLGEIKLANTVADFLTVGGNLLPKAIECNRKVTAAKS